MRCTQPAKYAGKKQNTICNYCGGRTSTTMKICPHCFNQMKDVDIMQKKLKEQWYKDGDKYPWMEVDKNKFDDYAKWWRVFNITIERNHAKKKVVKKIKKTEIKLDVIISSIQTADGNSILIMGTSDIKSATKLEKLLGCKIKIMVKPPKQIKIVTESEEKNQRRMLRPADEK